MTEGPFFYRDLRDFDPPHKENLLDTSLLGSRAANLNAPFKYKEVIKLARECGVLEHDILHVFERRVGTLNDLEDNIKSFHPASWSLTDLDFFVGKHSVTAFQLHVALLKIPPSKVHERFGLNAIMWIAANVPDFDYYRINPVPLRSRFSKQEVAFDQQQWFDGLKRGAEDYLKFLSECLKLSREEQRTLRKAISTCNRWLDPEHSYRAHTVIRNFYLLSHLRELDINVCCDLQGKLKSSVYAGSEVSADRKAQFSLAVCTPIGSRDYGDHVKAHDILERLVDSTIPKEYAVREPYMDSPIGLVLLWKGQPQAVISFIASDPKTLTIVQIQGIVGKVWEAHRDSNGKLLKAQKLDESGAPIQRGSRGLIGLRWDLLLTRLVEEIAKSHGFSAVQIIPGRDNPWIGSEKGRKGFYAMEANRYNRVAEEMGYALNHQLAVWRYELSGDLKLLDAIKGGKNPKSPRAQMLRAEITPTQS